MDKYINIFHQSMVDSGLSQQTIDKHYDNISFYFNTFIKGYTDASFEYSHIYIEEFLGDYFIRKCFWSTPYAIGQYGISFRKFYKTMVDEGLVGAGVFNYVKDVLKENTDQWQQTCRKFNNPDQHFEAFSSHDLGGYNELKAEEDHSNKQLFQRYNPAADVKKCPSKMESLRDELNRYAKAAVHLYGVIDVEDFLDLYSNYTGRRVSYNEFYDLALPLILENHEYAFYKNLLVHGGFIDKLPEVDILFVQQADKPLYQTTKQEFLKYEDAKYHNNPEHDEFISYISRFFDEDDSHKLSGFESLIRMSYSVDKPLDALVDLIQGQLFNLELDSDELAKLFELYTAAMNNERIFENRGHSPQELFDYYSEASEHDEAQTVKLEFAQPQKRGRNDPCYCGSGKKYKKCCGSAKNEAGAILAREDGILFFKLWNGLLYYVNEFEQLVKDMPPIPELISSLPDELRYELSQCLFNHPSYIRDYAMTLTNPEEREIVLSWQNYRQYEMAYFVDQTPDYAVLMVVDRDEGNESKLVGVKGFTRSLVNVVRHDLPLLIHITLLPFKNEIVYDTFISSYKIVYGEDYQHMLGQEVECLRKQGIIESWD